MLEAVARPVLLIPSKGNQGNSDKTDERHRSQRSAPLSSEQ